MLKKLIIISSHIVLLLSILSCKKEVLPKPTGYLRLDYPVANYTEFKSQCPFTFEMNKDAMIKNDATCGLNISYPKMKVTIYLTYKSINNNLNILLRDAQKLTYEHAIKADGILEQPYSNPSKRVYGMFYRIDGNAATNSQFYVTDSIKHFITGSVYFYTKPNFDSIMPAASYLQNDMQRLVETLEWK